MAQSWQAVLVGGALDLRTPRQGIVHSVFERSTNLKFRDGIWTLLSDPAQISPLTLVLPVGLPSGLHPGMRVQVRAGYLGIGPVVIDARAASVWTPRPWPAPAPATAIRTAQARAAALDRAWPGATTQVAEIAIALRRGPEALASAVARTLGRGPGLTPSGDDVLLGFLAAAALLPEPGPLQRLAPVVAKGMHRTGDISRELLEQAARGLVARPLHDLGRALLLSDHDLSEAIAQALSVGATSGADGCLGLTAAIDLAISSQERFAA